MASSPKLEMRQGQTLVMTPQLQQSLKILQWSTQELISYLEEELEKNPLLAKEDGSEAAATESVAQDTTTSSVESGKEKEIADVLNPESSEGFVADDDDNYENNWDTKENSDSSADSGMINVSESNAQQWENLGKGSSSNSEYAGNSDGIENKSSDEESLQEHLLAQISVEFNSAEDLLIASNLIDMLDDSGYLTKDTKPIEEMLGCDSEKIENVILKLQTLDPPGVFARNLAECLALQLKDKDRFDPAMEALIENLELFAQGNMKKLLKVCGVSQEDLMDMIKEIKALDPKPGAKFDNEMVQTLIPDIYVRKNPYKEGWLVELNNESLPKLLVNKKYYSEIKHLVSGETEKKYLNEQINTANWLVKTLNQRAETILKVATELVTQQKDFFDKGIQYLKPMTLKHIAEVIEVHESTVGRVTSNKYVATPRGTFELKFFFSSSLGNSSGEGDAEHSSRSVKYRIKELIDSEDPKSILSDDKITEILNKEGVNVARRTVAKYRESINIPTSSQRRRQKKLRVIK